MSMQVVELFSGIQGEGTHVGERQIFLRLAGCNLACDYCDQPEARTPPRAALVERTPGRRDFQRLPNPLTTEVVLEAIRRLNRPAGLHRTLALTGGEPLMQAGELVALLPRLRGTGLAIFLETNGTRAVELASLRRWVNIVSMDIKLRSAIGRPTPWTAHETFLKTAVRGGCEVYIKAVVSAKSTAAEMQRSAELIAGVRKMIPLVIQPVTRVGRQAPRPPTPDRVLELQAAAAAALPDVRVIPQTHKSMGQR